VNGPLVTLTTDFGTADGYTAAVKGVLSSRAPAARILDLAHDISAHDVSEAAWLLLRAAPYFPAGTIHLAVVDPGVGGSRRGLLLELGGQFFVGPDNGIFSLVPRRLTGAWRGVALVRGRVGALPSSSAVFEARDVFAPAAAAVANALVERAPSSPRATSWSAERHLHRVGQAKDPGAGPLDLTRFGEPIADWARLPWPEPRLEGGEWVGEILRVDRFGNAVTNLTAGHGAGPLRVGLREIPRVRVYEDAPPGAAVALEGSSGFLELSLNRSSASSSLGLSIGDPVRLPADEPAPATRA
jgi:S-adenosylmethionine hydrolase